ncbi:Hypothetical protein, putative [Bodo saltans]|uniref:Uncharacterized protein n=1 Tax=Bodo saltans TaxID=75058 RepID=A0A0S4JTL8_BODSA|nr:Hypothetical protein, putative [Bodo saltans]|eukprot:CUG93369.1 Hypothetical protein, putative [Bodo saltans]
MLRLQLGQRRATQRAALLVAGAQQQLCPIWQRRSDPVYRHCMSSNLRTVNVKPRCREVDQRILFEVPHQDRRSVRCRGVGSFGANNATQSLLAVPYGILALHARILEPFFATRTPCAMPSGSLVSRSRALLSGNSTIEPEVMRMYERLQGDTIVRACSYAVYLQDKSQITASAKLSDDIVSRSNSLVTKDLTNPCELCYKESTVAFCTVARDSWFVAVIAEAPKLAHDIIRSVGVLKLRNAANDEEATIWFDCYAVANYSGRTECEVLAECLSELLCLRCVRSSLDPWKALEKGKTERQIPMIDASGGEGLVYVISSQEDWNALQDRHVAFDGVGGKNKLQYCRHFDVTDASTRCSTAETIILIGGESGSGKTMHMITGNREEADVVVYVRFALRPLNAEETEEPENVAEIRQSMKDVIAAHNKISDSEDLVDPWVDPWTSRNTAFRNILMKLVKSAMSNTNPTLDYRLKYWGAGSDTNKRVFRVRLCLDEIGSSTAFVSACCATSPANIRELLGWGDWVELRIIAGGTGVDAKSETLGSEASSFKYSFFSKRGMRLYWSMRRSLERKLRGDEKTHLDRARTELSTIKWANVEERKAALKNRDQILQATIKQASNANAKSREKGEHLDEAEKDNFRASQQRLILEGLFSAIESDGACGAALTNPRLAALIVARCNAVAEEIMKMELCSSTSGTNIRQKILHPVAQSFKDISGLSDASPWRVPADPFRENTLPGLEEERVARERF